jgi:hypothetical protein
LKRFSETVKLFPFELLASLVRVAASIALRGK